MSSECSSKRALSSADGVNLSNCSTISIGNCSFASIERIALQKIKNLFKFKSCSIIRKTYFEISSSDIFNLLNKIVQFCARRPSITDKTLVLFFPTNLRSSIEPSFCKKNYCIKSIYSKKKNLPYSDSIFLIS